jgi:hypothetical protein
MPKKLKPRLKVKAVKPEVEVTQCKLFEVQWRYCGKWRSIEVYMSLPLAMDKLHERRLACPRDGIRRFRLVRNYFWKQTRIIRKITVIPV